MNREDIIRMAQEARQGVDIYYNTDEQLEGFFERFAAIVASAEREDILAVIGDNQCECRCSEVVRDRGQA